MLEARFTKWDYGAGIATSYKRVGECNMCGDCCKAIIKIKVPRDDSEDDDSVDECSDSEYKYIWSEVYAGNDRPDSARGFIIFAATNEKTRCCALGHGNICTLNGEKPWHCVVWPTCPNDIKLFPRCSYSFEEVKRWEFDTA